MHCRWQCQCHCDSVLVLNGIDNDFIINIDTASLAATHCQWSPLTPLSMTMANDMNQIDFSAAVLRWFGRAEVSTSHCPFAAKPQYQQQRQQAYCSSNAHHWGLTWNLDAQALLRYIALSTQSQEPAPSVHWLCQQCHVPGWPPSFSALTAFESMN